jgi:hypothetical protein
MKRTQVALIAAAAALCSACATTSTGGSSSAGAQPPAAAAVATPSTSGARVVKSRDGKYTGEFVGTPAADAKFAKWEIGMDTNEVQEILGRTPDRSHSYESGKRWIPFYFGNDARRMQVLYKGEGCLIFTGGNVWGGAGGDLIQVTFDAAGTCYEP